MQDSSNKEDEQAEQCKIVIAETEAFANMLINDERKKEKERA